MTGCNNGFSHKQTAGTHETHISTIQGPPREDPRISRAHENSRWPRGHPGTQGKRPGSSRCLTPPLPNRSRVLRDPAVFTAILRRGRSAGSRNFLVKVGESGLPWGRLGIIAAKRVARRAVDRNRSKRLIREVFHARRENLVALDLVVQLRSDLRSQENSSIRAELAKLMDKVRRRPDPA